MRRYTKKPAICANEGAVGFVDDEHVSAQWRIRGSQEFPIWIGRRFCIPAIEHYEIA